MYKTDLTQITHTKLNRRRRLLELGLVLLVLAIIVVVAFLAYPLVVVKANNLRLCLASVCNLDDVWWVLTH